MDGCHQGVMWGKWLYVRDAWWSGVEWGVLVMYHKMNTYQRRMRVCVKHMCVTVCACNEYGICMITWSNAIPPEPERVLGSTASNDRPCHPSWPM